jgi:glucose/arabinose dehydrogenase
MFTQNSLLLLGLVILISLIYDSNGFYVQGEKTSIEVIPTINDPNLRVEQIATLHRPTSMALLGPDDLLVLKKDAGQVMRVVNDTLLSEPLLDVNVAIETERGMLGIAIKKHYNLPSYVFLYFTESKLDGDDECPQVTFCTGGLDPLGNRLYRYELKDNKLVNPKLLLDLPATPGSDHLGGAITIGPDDNIYIIVGDGDSCYRNSCERMKSVLWSQTSNDKYGLPVEGRGGILRVSQEGKEVQADGILGKKYPFNLYFAYGIRNGFGLDFDPLTGKLWDTENGPEFGDEINLVEPGFNSGWSKVQGIWKVSNYSSSTREHGEVSQVPENLMEFKGKGKYSSPEFIWNHTVGPTALKFLTTDKLGKEYKNDIFVGDFINGNIYHFDLNHDRNGLKLDGPLKDGIVNAVDETRGVIFGKGFGGISDIEVSDDGIMYVASITTDKIFKISPVKEK